MRSLVKPFVYTLIFVAGCGGVTKRPFVPGGGDDGGGGDVPDLVVTFPDAGGGIHCVPGEPPSCGGASVVRTCRQDGMGYDEMPCPDGATCDKGLCTCTPGDIQCMGQDVLKCGMDGMFHADHKCPVGTTCASGLCAEARCPEEMMSTNPHALPIDGWPRFRHDNRNSGSTPVTVANPPKLKWKLFIGGATLNGPLGGLGSGPVVNQNDIVFIGGGDKSMGGSLMSIDPNGMGMGKPKVLYTFPAQRGFGSSTPAVRQDGTAYFSSQNSNLYAIDPMGKQQWSFKTGSQADGDPIVTKDGTLIYSSDDGSLYALDPVGINGMGKLIWKSDLQTGPGEVDGGLAESCDGRIYAAGRNGWFAIDAKTGKTLWKVPATGFFAGVLSSPIVTADGRMFGCDGGGQCISIDPAGKVLWTTQCGPVGGGLSLGMTGGMVYPVCNDGALHALDAGTGKEAWSRPIGNKAREIGVGPITDGNGRIYVNSSDGNVYAFDATGKQLWKLPASGMDSSANCDIEGTMAIGMDGTLYVPGNDGTLYAFQ